MDELVNEKCDYVCHEPIRIEFGRLVCVNAGP